MNPSPRSPRLRHVKIRLLVQDQDQPKDDFLTICESLESRQSGVVASLARGAGVLKGGPLSPKGSRRHGLRRLLMGAPSPCEAEFRNLTWLRTRLFRAAEPLGALTLSRFGFPYRELLITRQVPHAAAFDDALLTAGSRRRSELFAELGREVGRMHALRFLHADLYPRNVLVTAPCAEPGPGYGRSLIWLDAWAGGPTAWRRGNLRRVEDDLGAWMSLAADWMGPADEDALFAAYANARRANGRPVRSVMQLVRSIQRSRRRELARLEREPRRLRGRPFPIAGWDPDVGRLGRAVELDLASAARAVVSPAPVV